MFGQDINGVRRRGQDADALLRRQTEALGLGAGQVHPGMGLLEDPREYPPRRHIPMLAFPGELVALPHLGQHR